MSPNATPLSNAPLRGNFMLLRADTLRLVLPQADILSTEHFDAKGNAEEHDGFVLLPHGRGSLRVGALSDRMALSKPFPRERFMVTVLAGEEVAWAWSDVKVLADARLEPLALPPALLLPDAPVDACIEDEDGIAFLCTGRRLASFALARRG